MGQMKPERMADRRAFDYKDRIQILLAFLARVSGSILGRNVSQRLLVLFQLQG